MMNEQETAFLINKSGIIGKTYIITDINKPGYITAQRSASNRIKLYLFFLVAIVVDILLNGLIWTTYKPFCLLILIVITQLTVGIRCITVYNTDEQLIGTIKSNLFFTRWEISELSSSNNATFRFGLFKRTGRLETRFNHLVLEKKYLESTVTAYDSNDKFYFILTSLDSKYTRKEFRIDTKGYLDSNLLCMAAICIIERSFRPKTRNEGGP